MKSDFQSTLRRLKPEKQRSQLRPRRDSDLAFLGTTRERPAKLLYDTTVYIDILQNRFPLDGERMLRSAEAWHSPVTEAELAAAIGLLDPARPDLEIWQEAGVLSGMLARLQGYGKDQRRRALNDALLFASARKYGCVVLTRNVVDFDFLEQLEPSGKVLFYR